MGEELVQQLQMSARIGAGQTLKPGTSASISRSFEDGGLKPNRFEVVRLYGVQ